ncbi:MAG TPA: class I SAM-dependent methyltransferase [Kineosporiaceae bacterium]|nr:class I SAM-dependent methyltransferase [Kineosporiaceae bacterium]
MSAPSGFSAAWLTLREPADALARDAGLAAELAGGSAAAPAGAPGWVIHDLGCGTGSMGRWLVPRLPGPQHWVLHDRDPELLTLAAAGMVEFPGDGEAVTAQIRQSDVTALTGQDFAGARLVTASALLDLLTAQEVRLLAEACVDAGCAALFTLSVAGQVKLTPADPLDDEIAAAFNAHQRRTVDGRSLLGPDATAIAADAFTRLGAKVRVRPSPWRLGPDRAALTVEWLRGWVGAALEQRPHLQVEDYLHRRLTSATEGRLRVVVAHDDVLARQE